METVRFSVEWLSENQFKLCYEDPNDKYDEQYNHNSEMTFFNILKPISLTHLMPLPFISLYAFKTSPFGSS